MKDTTARLSIDGIDIDLPVYSPSAGSRVIDIASLTAQGYFTYDPGFVSTASCDSAITYIDGDEGVLVHRGYPIEQLAEHSTYLELCYLLLHGELPNLSQLREFCEEVQAQTYVDERLVDACRSFPMDAHPMGVMCALLGAMSAFYHKDWDATSATSRMNVAVKLIGQVPVCASIAYRHSQDVAMIDCNPKLDYGEHFLHMMFSRSSDEVVNPVLAKAMDRIFLLHADHEQNASTSTVRLAGSTEANPYACIAAGIAALWGPSHGGANEAVLNMLDEIGSPENCDTFVDRAKDKDDPFRLMGFGHRVYKNYDPRATVMQQTCDEVLAELGVENDPILQLARALEKVALEDEYFVDRRLYPNVDFYSGIILKAMGIPTELFTVIFTTGRTSGWIAQWNEMVSDSYKIGRPRQLYKGNVCRDYVPIEAR